VEKKKKKVEYQGSTKRKKADGGFLKIRKTNTRGEINERRDHHF